MKYFNEFVLLWYMASCSYILLSTNDSSVYISFIGLHVFVIGLYKYMQEREAKRYGDHKQVSSE